jgi:magnesium chelatase subunit D
LSLALKTLRTDRLKERGGRSILVILSDGEANVPLVPGSDKVEEVRLLGRAVQKEDARVIFVDTNPLGEEKPEASLFAGFLGAEYRRVTQVRAEAIWGVVEGGFTL